ncbi:MAG: hypothetical protein K8F52_07105 [Candidatus Scalindua rubra]|nr:hypothetical protein [Candidatus Scalindua rubra]
MPELKSNGLAASVGANKSLEQTTFSMCSSTPALDVRSRDFAVQCAEAEPLNLADCSAKEGTHPHVLSARGGATLSHETGPLCS